MGGGRAIKAEQVSFAAGEISPVLHARTDLTRYRIALAELVNMIVLPQGGVTRRAGINMFGGTLGMNVVKLIPFEYSTTDSVILEFGDRTIRVWQRTSSGVNAVAAINGSPYTASEVKDLRHVQSGNVMFLAHKNHKPMMLQRNSLTSWTLQELPFRGGPWITGEEWASGVKLRFSTTAASKVINSIGGNVFTSNLSGSLIKTEYAVAAKTIELTSTTLGTKTEPFVVKGTMNVTTAGDWTGLIQVDRSADGGNTWVTIRQYKRTNIETQGQWDFTISETEENILYRVAATHEGETFNGATSGEISNTGSSGENSSGGSGSGNSGGNSGDDSSEVDVILNRLLYGHPDVTSGENYRYLYGWKDSSQHITGTSTSNGYEYFYNPYKNITFYVVGLDEELADKCVQYITMGYRDMAKYGYAVDGNPEGVSS